VVICLAFIWKHPVRFRLKHLSHSAGLAHALFVPLPAIRCRAHTVILSPY
jgi:hypothetical protein